MTGKWQLSLFPNRILEWRAAQWGYPRQVRLWPALPADNPHVQAVTHAIDTLRPHLWSGAKDIHCTVFDSPIYNAWAMDGYRIAFYKGLLKKIERETENTFNDPRLQKLSSPLTFQEKLTAILAHELCHVEGRHMKEAVQWDFTIGALTLFLIETGYEFLLDSFATLTTPLYLALKVGLYLLDAILMISTIDLIATLLFGMASNRIVSQHHEKEADAYGMRLLQKAGVRPEAMLWTTHFTGRLQNVRAGDPLTLYDRFAQYVGTHPISQERIAHIQQEYDALKKGSTLPSPDHLPSLQSCLQS